MKILFSTQNLFTYVVLILWKTSREFLLIIYVFSYVKLLVHYVLCLAINFFHEIICDNVSILFLLFLLEYILVTVQCTQGLHFYRNIWAFPWDSSWRWNRQKGSISDRRAICDKKSQVSGMFFFSLPSFLELWYDMLLLVSRGLRDIPVVPDPLVVFGHWVWTPISPPPPYLRSKKKNKK